ncbi:MAG: uroporphyrinogen decarboxylase family protein [Eubacteriales bacterium]
MRWTREEYVAHLKFQDIGKEMFTELFGPLVGLDTEWKIQGASPKECDLTAFGWDYVDNVYFGNYGAITGITPRVLENTSEYIISIDHMGRKEKLVKASATVPLPMEYPVTTMDDWLKVKHWYAFREERVNKDELIHVKQLQEQGHLVISNVVGGFDELRQLLGEENLCIACYDEPEMLEDMLDTMATTSEKVMERIHEVLTIDNLFIHEDMAGKSGPLLGPKQIDKFIAPYYKRVWNCASSKGTQLFSQDSDGNMEAVIDSFIDCGVNVFYPFEPAAGMDMVAIRQKYKNKFGIKGGIDKHVLRMGKEDIRKELEYKLQDSMRHGGTIFAIDHRIPNGVSLENYRYYVNLGREILDLPPIQELDTFYRMAF